MWLLLLTQIEDKTAERNVADVQSETVNNCPGAVNVIRVNRLHNFLFNFTS